MGEKRAAKGAGFNQQPRDAHRLGKENRRDPCSSLLQRGVFSTIGEPPYPAHVRGSRAKLDACIAEGRVLIDFWVGVSGRGQPWELLSSWQESKGTQRLLKVAHETQGQGEPVSGTQPARPGMETSSFLGWQGLAFQGGFFVGRGMGRREGRWLLQAHTLDWKPLTIPSPPVLQASQECALGEGETPAPWR